jgi:hypothetical protein
MNSPKALAKLIAGGSNVTVTVAREYKNQETVLLMYVISQINTGYSARFQASTAV